MKVELNRQVSELTTDCNNAKGKIEELETTIQAQNEQARSFAKQKSIEDVGGFSCEITLSQVPTDAIHDPTRGV